MEVAVAIGVICAAELALCLILLKVGWNSGYEARRQEEIDAGYKYYNPDAGLEWSDQHPIDSGEVPDAEDVEPMTRADFCRRHPAS